MNNIILTTEDIPEICRYAGFGKSTPTPGDMERIEAAIDTLNKAAGIRHVLKECTIEECSFFEGEDIFRHLEGCHTVVLMAATTGAGVDACIRKAGISDVASQLFMDAAASAFIEKVCDHIEGSIRAEVSKKGGYLTWRFSPGYGDMPLECQKSFADFLNTGRRIGLSVNASGIMIPTKSVTAIMGISDTPHPGAPKGCGECGLSGNCYLQKAGTPCHTQ